VKANECVKILNDNSPFWEGLSNEQYKEGEEINLQYRATENDINALNFYGDDAIKDPEDLLDTPKPYPKDKLISLGALEDFAKRIPTMGGLNHSLGKGSIAVGTYSGGMPSGAAADSIAWNGLAQGAKSTAIHGMAYGDNGVAIHGIAGSSNAIAIGPNVNVSASNGVGIGSNLNVD
jgi:hypothetical protein